MTTDQADLPVPPLSASRSRGTVAVILFKDCPLFDGAIPLAVFGEDRRSHGLPNYEVLACTGEAGPLPTTGGILIAAPYGLAAVDFAGTVVVPSWRSPTEPVPQAALQSLRRAAKEGARIIGLNSGVFVLAAAGLLDNREATTHWMHAPALARMRPSIRLLPRELYVDGGQFITGAGRAAGLDACLYIVGLDHGAEAAAKLARQLVFPGARPGGQGPYFDGDLPEAQAGPTGKVMTWALEHLAEPFTINALAGRAGLSRRAFDRQFRQATGTTPMQWLNAHRILLAQQLLETTDLSLAQIAQRSGLGTVVSLRGHFRRQLRMSPVSYRRAYQNKSPQHEKGEPGPIL
jgi:transcriptional regulator GlxA family with amidase domain